MNPLISYPKGSDAPTSTLPFSPAVVVGGLSFVSGQASVDAAGSDLARVVETRNCVRDPADLPEPSNWASPSKSPDHQ